jgi:hypothetical protein
MAHPTRFAAAVVAGLWAGPVAAMTLEEALATAYATNPQLASARAAPILAELEPWLRLQYGRLSRKSDTAKALAYVPAESRAAGPGT